MNKSILSKAIFVALGLVMVEAQAVIPPGDYEIIINTTATTTTYYGGVGFKFGKDGAWESSFTFGGNPPSRNSQGMTDNAVLIPTPSGPRGSSVLGDGAGKLGITVDATGGFVVTSFQKDAIFKTAGGTFVQYGDVVDGPGTFAGIGTIDTSCRITLTPTGRRGAVGGSFPVPGGLHDERWNVDDGCNITSNPWTSLTTGTFTIAGGQRITGRPVTIHPNTDVNGDGAPDFKAIFVTGGRVGLDWGGFCNAEFFEAWNVDILSVNVPIAQPGVCTASPVIIIPPPIPEPTNSRDSFHPGSITGCSLSSKSGGAEWLLIIIFLAMLKSPIFNRRQS